MRLGRIGESVCYHPGAGKLRLARAIVIPPLTLEAFKSTVLNCFLFRQTDLIPCTAVRELTPPLDFNQQRSARKVKALFPFGLHFQAVSDQSHAS
jgi:hypothetical protein